ncbi:MAG: ATP-binding protein [Actinobacteria bacterium]|nr:MAG: ATP-binding protein [Actinomycetota bacterium]TML49718.1 MAG: ATP-binding protein [Actinomycetota bacterium]TML68716.1 MAG: ATP-binding protein [Actinomycetota bacterium]
MNDTVVRLTFPAKADYLLLARLALAGLARSLPLDPELVADLKLAVTEACGNAVRHAYTDSTGPIMVEFVTADDRLEMIVEDRGSGFDGGTIGEWENGKPPEGGMGMAIMRAVVDELDVRGGDDGHGTVVRMTKYLPVT